jgi:glycosidase
MKDNLMTVLSYADGVRCDVASLILNDVFGETWKEELEFWGYKRPKNEFWEYALEEAKAKYPNSIFLAEVFVDWEIELLYKLGFTYTYNLDLLQKLKGDSNEVNTYMKSLTLDYLEHSAHFVENHDIERVVYSMGNNIEKAKAAGTIAATVGGMIFIYHGQWSGYVNRLEVHLRRQVEEKENEGVKKYYQKLMKILKEPAFTSSSFHYIDDITGNLKDNLVAYIRETEDNHYLIVVNYSSNEGCSHVPIYNVEPKDGRANFLEVMEGYQYAISEDAIKKYGLTVCLNPWETKIYKYNY